MSLLNYDDYVFDPKVGPAGFALPDVRPIFNGDKISGFVKITNCAEIARLYEEAVICYTPEQQRGFRVTYQAGQVTQMTYMINPRKVKQIARNIAENTEHNRFRTVNCRHGHVELFFEPSEFVPLTGTLHIRRRTPASDDIPGLLTMPDSAHRQAGDRLFTNEIARKNFSPEHAGFTPETYDLILHITLTDQDGEGQAHYEHNELVSPSTPTRRVFLEGGKTQHNNWVAHELRKINPMTRELVEIYAKNISKNSTKIITLATLAKGIEDGWRDWLTEQSRAEVSRQIDAAMRLAREEVPEWTLLPYYERQLERENYLYSQAIVQRAMLRIFGDWHKENHKSGQSGDWERWRPQLRSLKQTEWAIQGWRGEFLSRANPLFNQPDGGSIYGKRRTASRSTNGDAATIGSLGDLAVQNTHASQNLVYNLLTAFFSQVGTP